MSEDPAVRSDARRRIWRWPRRRREAVLCAAMAFPDQAVRQQAAFDLAHWGLGEEVLAEHLLGDESPPVRLVCCAMLGRRRYSGNIDALIWALSDPYDKVAEMACIALAKRGDTCAAPALRRLLTHPAWRVRWRACKALVQLGAVNRRLLWHIRALRGEEPAGLHDADVQWGREVDASRWERRSDIGYAEPTVDELLATVDRLLRQKPEGQS